MTLNRRLFLGTAATLAAMRAVPLRAQDSAVEGTITIGAYSGIFQDKYTKAVIEPFMRKFPGIKVSYFPNIGSAQTLATLRAQKSDPQVDISITDISISKVGTDEGLMAPLDMDRIPSLAELDKMATMEGVNGRAVTFDNLELFYNSRSVQPAPTTWSALWDEKHAGRIVFNGIPDIVGVGLTIMADKLAGGDGTGALDAGFRKMADLAPLVQSFEPKPDAYALVINGSADMGVGWNARSQTYKDQSNGVLAPVLPEEGSVFQINTINLTSDSRNQRAAEIFINYALGTEAQKSFTETMFYAPTNTKTEVNDEAMKRTAIRQMDKMIPVNWLEIAKLRNRMTENWRRHVLTASR